MKRLFTIFLCCVLVVSCVFGVFPTTSFATAPSGDNLIVGGDFTNGTGYTTNTTIPIYNDAFVTAAGYRTWFRNPALPDVVKNDADSHGNYLQSNQYAYQGVPLETGKTYTLTFDLKVLAVNSGKTTLKVYLATPLARGITSALAISNLNVDGFVGTENVAYVNKSTVWYTHSLTFTVSASAPSGVPFALAFFNDDTSSNSFCLDNVSLYEGAVGTRSNLMYDDSFDITTNSVIANSSVSETVSVITQQVGHDGLNTRNWHQGTGLTSQYSRVTSSDAHTGSKSMIVCNYLHQSFTSETNAVYQLSFWAKSKGYDKLSFRFVENINRAVAINTEGSRTAALSNEWALYTYTITMPQLVSSKTLLSFYTNNTSGDYTNFDTNDVYLDDVTLERMNLMSPYAISATAESGGNASVSTDSAYLNQQVTFTAVPDSGYTFSGWFATGQETPVSAELVYTVTVTGDLALTAKFSSSTSIEDPDNLLYDSTFSKTTSIATAQSYDTVTYESAHIWYQPGNLSKIESSDGNSFATLNEWIYQSVPIEANTDYSLTFKAKQTVSGKTFAAYIRALKNRGTILKTIFSYTTEADGEWKEYTVLFSINDLNSSYTDYALGFMGTGTSVSLDDIVLKKVTGTYFDVAAVAETGGSASVSSNKAVSNQQVTFTAVPNSGYTFLGWFAAGQSTPVSTNTIYTCTVTADLTLTAKFQKNSTPEDPEQPEDPDTLLYDGSFSKTTTIAQAESYDTVTYDSAHIWYQPSGNKSKIQKDGNNSYATLTEWIYQSVPIEAGTAYSLSFKAKQTVAGKTFAASIRALKSRTVVLKTIFSYTTTSDSEWNEYTILFSVPSLNSSYADYVLGITATGTSTFVDDIVLKKVSGSFYNVTAAAFRGGKATVDSSMVVPGGTATFTATPDSGNIFRGWYLNGNTAKKPVSTNAVYSTVVTSDLFLVAVFDGPGIPKEDFSFLNPGAETGDVSGWVTSTTDAKLSVSTTEKHSGNSSFQFEPTAENQYLTTQDGILLKSYHTYKISVWLKSLDIYPRVQVFSGKSYAEGQNDFVYGDKIRMGYTVLHQIGSTYSQNSGYSALSFDKKPSQYEGAENGWVQYSMTFSTKSTDSGTIVKFSLRNKVGVGVLYLDDIKVTETPVDIFAQPTDQTYCEALYNQVKNPSFENVITNDDWGTPLPSGWSIQAAGAALGKKYLKTVGSGVYYKKLTVKPETIYHLGVSLKSAKSSNAYIAITSDQNGTMFNNISGKPASFVKPIKYNNTWERVGMKFSTSDSTNEVYLMIYNPSGELAIDNVCFFQDQFAYTTDPNDYAVRVGYDYDGIGYTGDEEDSTSVPTGDNSAQKMAGVLILLIAVAWVMAVARPRRSDEEVSL